MEKHKKSLEELQRKLGAILYEVDQKKISHYEAANRVVQIKEEMEDLINEMKNHSLPSLPKK